MSGRYIWQTKVQESPMSVASSAIKRLQEVAERADAVTVDDERAAAVELNVPVAALHGAATFYDDLAQTRRGKRHVRVWEDTACFAAAGRTLGPAFG
jgi:NADH:ubiquinone oxidoreductase subunit E